MHALILAVEAADPTPPGDDLMTVALVMVGVAMLITAITTWIVTPRGERH